MGPWDDEVESGFDDMFDLNKNGMLDSIERAFQMEFLDEMSKKDEFSDDDDDLWGGDDDGEF